MIAVSLVNLFACLDISGMMLEEHVDTEVFGEFIDFDVRSDHHELAYTSKDMF